MTRTALAILLALASFNATAQPSTNYTDYVSRTEKANRGLGLALVVGPICHLRSTFWFRTLEQSVYAFREQQAQVYNLTKEERSAGMLQGIALQQQTTTSNMPQGSGYTSTCRALLNSADLVELDKIQHNVTGNYH